VESKKVSSLFTHRVGVHALYYNIARSHAATYHERDAELTRLETSAIGDEEVSEYERRIELCYTEREQAAMVAITFSGMALEAFFYDYGAENLGDQYVETHLDKLDLKSKFVLYPRLIGGKEPDKWQKAYQSLARMVKLRNDLVHFKSKPFPITEMYRASEYHDYLNKTLKLGVDQSVQCVLEVMDELDRLHDSGSLLRSRMTWSIEEVQK
jgi:hypothetical protein